MAMATTAGMVSALAVLPCAPEGLLAAPYDHYPVCRPNIKITGRPELHLALEWPVASYGVCRRVLHQVACTCLYRCVACPSDCACYSSELAPISRRQALCECHCAWAP